MTKKFFFIGFFVLGLAVIAKPSSASDPSFVAVGDGGANCLAYDSPYIGFADCQTLTGGYGTLAVTPPGHAGRVEWFTDVFAVSTNYTVTSESSEFAGVPGTCGTGDNFDWQFTYIGESFLKAFVSPGSCYYYCKIHGPALMRGVVIVPGVGSTTTTSTTTTTRPTTTTTTPLNHPPSLDSLTPVNISTVPSVAQSFTSGYSDPDGYQNIAEASLALSGAHSETLHYNPATNQFTLQGVGGNCAPGQATTLSNFYLTLNCGASSASGSGTNLTVTYNLTPSPLLSGAAFRLILGVIDQGAVNKTKDMGYWVVNRPPHADSVMPMDSMTEPMMSQLFTAVYSDPDGYENIAEANFYLAGGMHNEWLHYISAANLFTMMGTSAVCSPGDAITLSNGFLTLDCGASSVSGWEHQLTITFYVTPQMSSTGINYNIFTGVSDHAAAAHGLFAGTWGIQ